MDKSTVKHISGLILKGIVITLACLFVFRYCGGCDNNIEVEKSNNDSLFLAMRYDSLLSLELSKVRYQDSINILASKYKEDSLNKLVTKFEVLYRKSSKTVREQISEGICDTNSVKIALDDCEGWHKVAEMIIAQKDTTIKLLEVELEHTKEDLNINKGIVTAARIILKNQADDYKALEKSSKKALKRQKIKTGLAIIGGAIVEGLTIFVLK